MTLSGLRSRAARKRAYIKSSNGKYTVLDRQNDTTIGTADSLLTLEDLINQIDETPALAEEQPEKTKTFLIMGGGIWGSGPTLDDAKKRFRREGGRLNYHHGIYEFDEDTEFFGVDAMGYYSYKGNAPTLTTKRKP